MRFRTILHININLKSINKFCCVTFAWYRLTWHGKKKKKGLPVVGNDSNVNQFWWTHFSVYELSLFA